MVDEEFLKYLQKRFKGRGYERIKDMATLSFQEFIEKELVEEHQNITAMVNPFSNSMEVEGYPICRVELKADTPGEVSLAVLLDGKELVSEKIRVDSGNTSKTINHPKPELIGEGCKGCCAVIISDSFGRILSRSEFTIRFSPTEKKSLLKASVSLNGYPADGKDSVRLATVNLSLEGDETACTISAYADSRRLVARTVTVPTNGSVTKDLDMDLRAYPNDPQFDLKIVVESDDKIICESSGMISRPPHDKPSPGVSSDDVRFSVDAKPSGKSIFADCMVRQFVDVHEVKDNCVHIGGVKVVNKTPGDQTVHYDLVIEGEVVVKESVDIPKTLRKTIEFNIPAIVLYNEDTVKAGVECHMYDSEGLLILSRMYSSTIRSKYDLNLKKLKERTAQFVNPLDPAIKRIVVSKDGAVAKAMMKEYGFFQISGYQSKSSPSILMECAYNAVRDMGLSYVSDTFSFNQDEERYQRVRTPSKVLEDRSGNCIELSILFASIFESMALEPVVIFPPGHAIVGVVVSTNDYPSDSNSSAYEFPFKPLRVAFGSARYYDAIFLESTLCAQPRSTYEMAIKCAYECIIENKDYIVKNQNFTLVSKLHSNGFNPEVM